MNVPMFQQLLHFFKVVGNEDRLKILGLLANRSRSVVELADKLDLKESSVSHHLAVMRELGIVMTQPQGNTRLYTLDTEFLEAMNKEIFSEPDLARRAENASGDDWESKVRQAFIENGRLVEIPSRRKKQAVIMQWIVDQFDNSVEYPEAVINERLKALHPDYASLRRYLIEHRLMQRADGVYWRI